MNDEGEHSSRIIVVWMHLLVLDTAEHGSCLQTGLYEADGGRGLDEVVNLMREQKQENQRL